jgi:hypothetical protein
VSKAIIEKQIAAVARTRFGLSALYTSQREAIAAVVLRRKADRLYCPFLLF